MKLFNWLRGTTSVPDIEAEAARDACLQESIEARRAGDLPRAEQLARAAIEADPNCADAWCALAAVAFDAAAIDSSLEALARAEVLDPKASGLHNLRGSVLWMRGDLAGALASFHQAVRYGHEPFKAWFNLALVHRARGELDAAIDALRSAIAVDGDGEDAHALLGEVLQEAVRLEEALDAYDAEIGLNASAAAWSGRGATLLAQGRIEEALAALDRALVEDPANRDADANRLLSLQYDPHITAQDLFAAHVAYDTRHMRDIAPLHCSQARTSRPDGRVRIGYLSGDFNRHSVAYFIEPVIECHDRGRFEVFCYYTGTRNDAFTARFRTLADRFADVAHLDDTHLAASIHADDIDILVDLSGHTGGNRLSAVALRPAPIQVIYLGYPSTTGLSCFDYRITDARADPPGFERFSSERLVRLPESYFCYRPPQESPAPAPPPGATRAGMTFGSFNNLPKLNDGVLESWARILDALPESRLILKNRSLFDDGTRQRLEERIERGGMDARRVELRAPTKASSEHLAVYREIDIALDTFPYNGATTSCEALWMGVPVVSLAGARSAARMGASILETLGLDHLVVDSVDAYVERVVALAGDIDTLTELHAQLRDRVARSPLMNERAFVSALEDAYLSMLAREI